MQTVLVLNQRGVVNKIFDIIPNLLGNIKLPVSSEEYNNLRFKNKDLILKCLRKDTSVINFEDPTYENGDRVFNPSKKLSDIKSCYSPFLAKRQEAEKIPYKISSTVTLIDSFVCYGSRFGLKRLMTIVQVYESTCNERIWANIYYISDSEIPEVIITVDTYFTRNDT